MGICLLCEVEPEFISYYCTDNGMPQKLVPVLLTALIFKEMNDFTDDEIIEQLIFDRRYQYALDNENLSELYICRKTLYNFRQKLPGSTYLQNTFDHVVKLVISDLNLKTDVQRADSPHVFSNMAYLGRLGLLVKVVENLLR